MAVPDGACLLFQLFVCEVKVVCMFACLWFVCVVNLSVDSADVDGMDGDEGIDGTDGGDLFVVCLFCLFVCLMMLMVLMVRACC